MIGPATNAALGFGVEERCHRVAARRQVQITFQDPSASLNPRLRVADILDEGLAARQPELEAAARRGIVARQR